MSLKNINTLFKSPVEGLIPLRNPDFKDLMLDKLSRQAFMKHNGFGLTKIELGYVESYNVFEPWLQQQDGILHGGVISTIQDIVMGFAAFTTCEKDDRVVTSELSISYLNPGRGNHILARGWVTKAGKRLCYCESEVYMIDDHGQIINLISKGKSLMAVLENRNKEVSNNTND